MADEWTEIAVFMHGITPEREPGPHHPDYSRLFSNIQASLTTHPDKPKLFESPVEVEWGWQGSNSEGMDQFLALAEFKVLSNAERAEQRIHDPTIDPRSLLRVFRPMIRELLILGFADMFYYVSKDGEAAIRRHVFTYLAEQIQQAKRRTEAGVSLTFVGHSGGGIIIHDLLYHLFRAEDEPEYEGIIRLRDLIKDKKLRLRRFYTLGSPITPLMFRSDSLVDKLSKGERLKPKDIGFRDEDGLSNPRWVNFVDKDDMASYPLEFLYENPDGANGKIIEDKHIDVSDNPFAAHGSYWASSALAAYIAETF